MRDRKEIYEALMDRYQSEITRVNHEWKKKNSRLERIINPLLRQQRELLAQRNKKDLPLKEKIDKLKKYEKKFHELYYYNKPFCIWNDKHGTCPKEDPVYKILSRLNCINNKPIIRLLSSLKERRMKEEEYKGILSGKKIIYDNYHSTYTPLKKLIKDNKKMELKSYSIELDSKPGFVYNLIKRGKALVRKSKEIDENWDRLLINAK